MKSITVLGWYGHGNAGDESYKVSLPLLFPNCNLSFTDRLTEQQKKSSDAFILGGGAVVEPAFLNQLQNLKQKKILLSVTATKNTPVEQVKKFDTIIVRDIRSQKTLATLGINNSKLMPDCAFLLQGDKHTGYDYLRQAFQQHNLELYDKIVCVVYNAHLGVVTNELARDHLNFLKTALDLADIIDNTKASFVFIPFGQSPPWDDRVTNSWLASRCKFWKKNLVIYDRISFQQLLNIIACSDAVISTRLHASIFSCVTNTPFIDITHHDKNLGFLETIEKTNWSIPYWQFEAAKCSLLLEEFLSNNKPYREALANILTQQRAIIREVVKQCISPITDTK